MDVFGKDESFDPQEESIVCVRAGEVGRRLLQAYQKSFDDDIQIELLVGCCSAESRIRPSDRCPEITQ